MENLDFLKGLKNTKYIDIRFHFDRGPLLTPETVIDLSELKNLEGFHLFSGKMSLAFNRIEALPPSLKVIYMGASRRFSQYQTIFDDSNLPELQKKYPDAKFNFYKDDINEKQRERGIQIADWNKDIYPLGLACGWYDL